MFIRDSKWKTIRDQFTESEKEQLRSAVEGEVICPRGFLLNVDRLSEELKSKAQSLLGSR
jgi:hypothetical protein